MPIEGATASYRPAGVARYFGAAFLGIWIVGWALGEAFAVGFAFLLIRSIVGSAIGVSWPIQGGEWIAGGAAGFALIFISFWLALWTLGGVAAITQFLRSVGGEDRIEVHGTSVTVTRRAGPFRRAKSYDRSDIRAIRLRSKDQAVMIDTATASREITRYGTPDERKQLADWLKQRLVLAASSSALSPRGWLVRTEGVETYLTRTDPRSRLIGASIAWVITLLSAMTWVGAMATQSRAGAVASLVITALLAAFALWLTFGRSEWLVRPGLLTFRLEFLAWARERTFQSARLAVSTSTDSDGDRHYKLTITDAQGSKTIATEMNDDADTMELARWLAARSGFPLT